MRQTLANLILIHGKKIQINFSLREAKSIVT